MRMLQPGRRADLAKEPLAAEALRERGEQDLEGDGAIVSEIVGEVDDGHAPAPELPLERVSLPQRLLQAVARLRGRHDEVRAVDPTWESGSSYARWPGRATT
jgi:hypothetical protein